GWCSRRSSSIGPVSSQSLLTRRSSVPVRRVVVFLWCLALPVAVVSCTTDEGTTSTPAIPSPVRSATTTPTAPPTPPAGAPTPHPAVPATPPPPSGARADPCVGGWFTPTEGSSLWTFPLDVIRRAARISGPLRVVDMRTFVGPESPPTDKNYLKDIRRWYVKLY